MHSLLQNECYIGNIACNRRFYQFGQFQGLLEPALFRRAQQRMKERYICVSNEKMLKGLRLRLKRREKLTANSAKSLLTRDSYRSQYLSSDAHRCVERG
jgi:hypothetical protein